MVVFERRILPKNNDRRQTSSEVKPGQVELVLGWVSCIDYSCVYYFT